jgi:nitric oxide reductase NorD protein
MGDTLERFANGVRVFFGFPAKVYLDALEDSGPLIHFMDIHHRMRIYLRALWDEDFILKQTNLATAYDEDKQPYIDDLQIYLPNYLHDLIRGKNRISGLERYRAAVAHVSAHLMYTRDEFSPRSLDKWQMAMIALIEDARIEALSIRQYPGLKRLWSSLHDATPEEDRTAGDYMSRLARALLDETYQDDDPWIAEGRRLFNAAENLEDSRTSRKIGVALADSFLQKKIRYHYGVDMARVPYRDDNRSMWLGYRRPMEIINPYLKSKIVRRIDEEEKNPDRIRTNKREAENLPLPRVELPQPALRSFLGDGARNPGRSG